MPETPAPILVLALVDPDDLVEHLERLVARPLEGVAADDRAVAAAVADGAHLVHDAILVLRLAAREDDDAAAVESGLHNMAIARGGAGYVDLLRLVNLLRGIELEMLGRRLDLDDMGAEEGRHVGGIGADVNRRLALL